MVNIQEIATSVKKQMPEKRWVHTQGVMKSAVELARRFGADETKAELAAVLHDVAKYWPVEKQKHTLVRSGYAEDLLDYDKSLWHAPVGAFIAEKEYGIEDQDILNAIRYHTSGRGSMSVLEKVVCLADYIEPGRDFPGVEKLRELSMTHLEEALLSGFDGTIQQLLQKRKIVYPLTLAARNGLLLEIQSNRIHSI